MPNLDLKPGAMKRTKAAGTDGRIKVCETCGTKHTANLRKCRKCNKGLPRLAANNVSFALPDDTSVVSKSSRSIFDGVDDESVGASSSQSLTTASKTSKLSRSSYDDSDEESIKSLTSDGSDAESFNYEVCPYISNF